MKLALTDRAIKKLVAPPGGRLEVLDAKMPGLALRVTPSGHKRGPSYGTRGARRGGMRLGHTRPSRS